MPQAQKAVPKENQWQQIWNLKKKIVLEVLASEVKQEKRNKVTRIRKEEIKLFLFAGTLIM